MLGLKLTLVSKRGPGGPYKVFSHAPTLEKSLENNENSIEFKSQRDDR